MPRSKLFPSFSPVWLIASLTLAALLCLSPAPASSDQILIKRVNPLVKDGNLFIEIDMTAPLAPQVEILYKQERKPMLVLDFLGADAPGLPRQIASPSPLAKRIRIGRHGHKVRIVVDLVPGFYYQADQTLIPEQNRYVVGIRKDPSRHQPAEQFP